jgi:hypothetical protein
MGGFFASLRMTGEKRDWRNRYFVPLCKRACPVLDTGGIEEDLTVKADVLRKEGPGK